MNCENSRGKCVTVLLTFNTQMANFVGGIIKPFVQQQEFFLQSAFIYIDKNGKYAQLR